MLLITSRLDVLETIQLGFSSFVFLAMFTWTKDYDNFFKQLILLAENDAFQNYVNQQQCARDRLMALYVLVKTFKRYKKLVTHIISV